MRQIKCVQEFPYSRIISLCIKEKCLSNLTMGLCEKLAKALGGVYFIRWIAIYPLDKVIRSLNNWGLDPVVQRADNFFQWINRYPAM